MHMCVYVALGWHKDSISGGSTLIQILSSLEVAFWIWGASLFHSMASYG